MEHAIGVVATCLGLMVRGLLVVVQNVVLATPALMVVYGVHLLSVPAAWIVAGLILAFMLYRPRGQR